jgi:pyruvate/2-oxoglutarate dehydrogenase complex dihydrolipoamide dehydrogenase (E3) component
MLKKNELISAPAKIQTVTPAIFAAADVCGPVEVVHIAIAQVEAAARNTE